jgi:hypothetical protein
MKKCLLLLITLGLPLSATHADVVKPRTEVVQLWSPDGAERFRRSGSTPDAGSDQLRHHGRTADLLRPDLVVDRVEFAWD